MPGKFKKIAIGRHEIVNYAITFPTGKKVVLNRKKPDYITDNPDEIAFLSIQRGLIVLDVDEQPALTNIAVKAADMPLARRTDIAREDVEPFLVNTEEEVKTNTKLEESGYDIPAQANTISRKGVGDNRYKRKTVKKYAGQTKKKT